MESDTPSGESGELDTVAMFEAALGKSFGEPPPDPTAKAPPAELEVPEEIDLGEEKPEDEKPDEPTETKTYKVKVDGKEIEVPEDELLKGYSRNQDYTKKTMELAAEKRQAQEVVAQVQAERQQYANQLKQLTAALGDQLTKAPDWNALLESDPVEYLKQQHLYNQRQAAYQAAQQEQSRQEQLMQEQKATAMQQILAQEREQLIANLPTWKDPAKAAAEQKALVNHLVERGYSKEDIGNLTDHKTVILAREAMLYRQMMAKAKETTKAVEKLPPRMEKPGVTRAPTDGRTVEMQALKRTGKLEDAAAAFMKRF